MRLKVYLHSFKENTTNFKHKDQFTLDRLSLYGQKDLSSEDHEYQNINPKMDFWDISVWMKMVDWPTNIAIHQATV